jgi:hypothetical protein
MVWILCHIRPLSGSPRRFDETTQC